MVEQMGDEIWKKQPRSEKRAQKNKLALALALLALALAQAF